MAVFPCRENTAPGTKFQDGYEEDGEGRRKFQIDQYSADVRATYAKVLILQAVVLAGLWMLQQAFL
jgi:hypothetical protein